MTDIETGGRCKYDCPPGDPRHTDECCEPPRHQCCGAPIKLWPHDRCMCVQPAKRVSVERPKCDCGGFAILDGQCADCSKLLKSGLYMPCRECGIPIPEAGENPDPAALVCDTCYHDDTGLVEK